jgi:hypothetical protein
MFRQKWDFSEDQISEATLSVPFLTNNPDSSQFIISQSVLAKQSIFKALSL